MLFCAKCINNGIRHLSMHLQDIILKLQHFWIEKGCALLQPYDVEVGAGTSHPAVVLRCLDNKQWNIVYVQPSRRPADGRYAENPNRVQHYYQLEVILKPAPDNMQELCMESMKILGLDPRDHDIRFVESDWANPTIGAFGLGYEVWCDGMELIQFTYMQQIGGIDISPVACEITYGLERLAMYIQNIDNIFEISWNNSGLKYKDVFKISEIENCDFNFNHANIKILKEQFKQHVDTARHLISQNAIHPAYDQGLKAAHTFNLLEARGSMSVIERAQFMEDVRNVVKSCCQNWIKKTQNQ